VKFAAKREFGCCVSGALVLHGTTHRTGRRLQRLGHSGLLASLVERFGYGSRMPTDKGGR
jgi:hypothetical protein